MANLVRFICHPDYAHYVDRVTAILTKRDIAWDILSVAEAAAHVEQLAQSSLVVTVHSVLAEVARLMAALRGRVPTLTLQDGIIEYRHADHAAAGGILRYRPLQTDQIAVFGDRSAALLRSFGVAQERIVVTGSCRILWEPLSRPRQHQGVVLVTAANRPAFNAAGTAAFYRLLDQVIAACRDNDIPFRLRLSRGLTGKRGLCRIETVESLLDPDLVVRFREMPVSQAGLDDDLDSAAAVLTTPSTVSLEAMAKGIPVGHLQFDDETAFLHPPWSVGRHSDVASMIGDMLEPPPLKMIYQDCLLRENLVPGDSAERIVHHMQWMMTHPQAFG